MGSFNFRLTLVSLDARIVPTVLTGDWSLVVPEVQTANIAVNPPTPVAGTVADPGSEPSTDLTITADADVLVIDDWGFDDQGAGPADPAPTDLAPPAGLSTDSAESPSTPQPPATPPPKKPAFDKIEDVTAAFNKNKVAADLLAEFIKAGGTVVSGDASTGAKIVFDFKSQGKPKIVLDPTKLVDGSDAVGALLFELIRWKNQQQQKDIVNKVKAGTMTPAEGATEYEKITYDYMTQQQKVLQDAVKAGDWVVTTDRLQAILNKYKTFDDFLKRQKEYGHYGDMEKQLQKLAPKKNVSADQPTPLFLSIN